MINVIAGVNGAGKSSVLGSWIQAQGAEYFNPDVVTRALMAKNPQLTLGEANANAWQMSFNGLCQAVENNTDYSFETTLGGNSICAKLHEAIEKGIEVNIFFCGLTSPELHIQRVAARVANGGHDIPESKIRERWTGAIHNILSLIPGCAEITVFDNSADLIDGKPSPILLFSLVDGMFASLPVSTMPEWAKPLATAAMKRHIHTLS